MYSEKLKEFMEKFKGKKGIEMLISISIIGVVIVLSANTIFGKDNEVKTVEKDNITVVSHKQDNDNLQAQLKEILRQVEGVGAVDVMVTYSQSLENIYAENRKETISETSEKDSNGGLRTVRENNVDTTVQFNSGGNEPIIKKTILPKVQGVIVVAEGAGNSSVKDNIINAVQVTCGIGSYKVQVFKKNIN